MKAPFMWYGGKGNMIAKLLSLVPDGGLPYCEPFCGAASLFFARPPAPVEVLNDLDGNIVNLFRVLQDEEKATALERRLYWTPYARAERKRAYEILMKGTWKDDVERAWAFFVCANQGFSGKAYCTSWSFAVTKDTNGMADTTNKWLKRLSLFGVWRERLARVQIESMDAVKVIEYYDNPEAVFYLDPPYVHETRSEGMRDVYVNEMSDEDHRRLIKVILECKGAVVLSGYDSDLYRRLDDAGWERTEFETACYAAGRTRFTGIQGKGSALKHVPRTEVVSRNKKAVEMKHSLLSLDMALQKTGASNTIKMR